MQDKILIWNNSKTISLLKSSLENDKVCVSSSDTVLGLLSNISENGFQKLNEIKNRSAKSYIVLINSLEKLNFFIDMNLLENRLIKLINEIWPGPVTLIFKSKKTLPDYLKGSNETIAIRMPNHNGLLQILTYFNGLFSTSANIAGEKVPESLLDLDLNIVNLVEYIILDNFNKEYRYPVLPSTILDCTQKNIKILREGVIPIANLEKIYGKKFQK